MAKPLKAPQITLETLRLTERVTQTAQADFSGGLNAHDLPTEIADTQACDLLNLWYKDGLTRTRPGLAASGGHADGSKPALAAALLARVAAVEAPYIPTLLQNCDSRGGGELYEDRNLLTPWVRQQFSPASGDKQFKLADTLLDAQDVVIDYQAPVYTYAEHYVIPHASADPATGLPYVTFQNPTSGMHYKVTCDYTQGLIQWFRLDGSGNADETWPGFTDDAAYNVSNNLTVTYAKTARAQNPLAACTMAQWFGGSLSGLGNGSCLLAAGNPGEPNTFRWSAANDLTYWPENNFNSCGDASDPFTAMAKAPGGLILFKANSTYGVAYNASQPTSTTVPYEPFPQRLLHPSIGCDCPDTVELIGNGLTWLHSDGHIYRLVSYSNADEGNIVPLSRNIEPLLAQYGAAQLRAATACDTGGYYLLFTGGDAWAWDYGDAPYAARETQNDAQFALAWFRWQFASLGAASRAFFADGVVYLNGGVWMLDEARGDDNGLWFNACAVSRDTDFGEPTVCKEVLREWFTVTADEGTTLIFEMRDDAGALDCAESVTGASGTTLTVAYNQVSAVTRHFQAAVRRVAGDTGRFGVSRIAMKAALGRDVAQA